MKYIGKFSDFNIPISTEKHGRLFICTNNGVQIIVYYDREIPYHVKYIALLAALTEFYTTYNVYEYEYFSTNDTEVKAVVKNLVERLLKENIAISD